MLSRQLTCQLDASQFLVTSNDMQMKTGRLRDRIAKVFTDSMEEKPEVARDIAFHMTDWDHNLEDIVRLYEQQETLTDDEIIHIIIQFLAHVPEHVAAAKKLAGVGPITDIFEVGVLEEEEL